MQNAGHFTFGFQGPGLELDALETVLLDHAPGLGHDLLLVQRLAPVVRRVGRVDVLGVLEEQVGAEGHFIAHRTAEQVDQWPIQRPRLKIEQRHFEGRVGIGHGLAGM